MRGEAGEGGAGGGTERGQADPQTWETAPQAPGVLDPIAACEDPQMGESLVSAGLGSTLDPLTGC